MIFCTKGQLGVEVDFSADVDAEFAEEDGDYAAAVPVRPIRTPPARSGRVTLPEPESDSDFS
jgi:hypothetical protein